MYWKVVLHFAVVQLCYGASCVYYHCNKLQIFISCVYDTYLSMPLLIFKAKLEALF